MLKKSVTPQQIVKILNEMLKADYQTTYDLVTTRFNCNPIIAAHPTIQVHLKKLGKINFYSVGFMGMVNGFFGVNKNKFGCITYDCEYDEKTEEIGEILRFRYSPNLGKK